MIGACIAHQRTIGYIVMCDGMCLTLCSGGVLRCGGHTKTVFDSLAEARKAIRTTCRGEGWERSDNFNIYRIARPK